MNAQIVKSFIKLLLVLSPVLMDAEILKIGENVNTVMLKSQHDVEYRLVENGIWVVTWEKIGTREANRYFDENKMDLSVNMIVDVSQAPSGIFNLFILPDLKRYKHPILLSYDEAYNLTLPYKEDCITVLKVEDKKIVDIKYVDSKESLAKVFNKVNKK